MTLVNKDSMRGGGIGTGAGAGVPAPMVTTTSADTGDGADEMRRLAELERAFVALRDELIRLQVIDAP